MAPVLRYECKFDDIIMFGTGFKWTKFRSILYRLTITYTGENSLELDVLNELCEQVSLLCFTLHGIVNCMNTHPKARRSIKLWNISTEGHDYYDSLRYLVRDCVNICPKNMSSENYRDKDWFIKKLLGVKGFLFDILKLIHNIKLWYPEARDLIELYPY